MLNYRPLYAWCCAMSWIINECTAVQIVYRFLLKNWNRVWYAASITKLIRYLDLVGRTEEELMFKCFGYFWLEQKSFFWIVPWNQNIDFMRTLGPLISSSALGQLLTFLMRIYVVCWFGTFAIFMSMCFVIGQWCKTVITKLEKFCDDFFDPYGSIRGA